MTIGWKLVDVFKENRETLYECEECHFTYRDNEWAEKCQAWCSEFKSCNLEIIQHAVSEKGGDSHG